MACKREKVAIIGAGPAGCMCAYFASMNFDVTLFDAKPPLHTLLYTGGGRCNLAYAEYDFKELAKYYPRGEKFLYSVFSRFSTADTIDFFDKIGVETYTQEDFRMFPVSNSAKDVREKFLKSLKNCTFIKENVLSLESLLGCPAEDNGKFLLKSDKNDYIFDIVVIAIGGHAGFALAETLGHRIISPKPALTGLITAENLKPLQGVSLKNVKADISYQGKKIQTLQDDLIFTHEGISGPLAYKISSVCARLEYDSKNPIQICLNFLDKEIDLQDLLNLNPKKDVKNLISGFVTKSLAEYIARKCLCADLKCHEVNGKMRDFIYKFLTAFEINVVSPSKDGEVVTSGGVSLDEINPKTMESKLVKDLYFCGEVIDVDGFCGGFNLQNCWSTGFLAASNLG